MARLDPAISFTPTVAAAFGEKNITVVHDAVGGQPIRRWYKGWKSATGELPKGSQSSNGDLYDRLMKKVSAASKGKEFQTVTFLWMQGERDANQKHGEVYADSFKGLVKQLENDLGRDDVNFVIGRLSDFDMKNKKYPHWTMVREVQVKVAQDDPKGAWVDTDDLNDGLNKNGKQIKDDLHYSVDGYRVFGERLARKSIQLINGDFFTPEADRKNLKTKSKYVEGLPNVLIIGDSISVGYSQPLIAELKGVANVSRIPENGGDTGRGLAKIEKWLAEKRWPGGRKWDVIHFNWGLWDLCYRHPKSKTQGKRDKVNGTVTHSVEEYSRNLEALVIRLKKTDAKLIWAATTFVPQGEAGRFEGDDQKYNAAARKVMEKHGIPINDLNTFSQTIQEDFVGPGNVHFTKQGSQKLGRKVAEEIKKVLPTIQAVTPTDQ